MSKFKDWLDNENDLQTEGLFTISPKQATVLAYKRARGSLEPNEIEKLKKFENKYKFSPKWQSIMQSITNVQNNGYGRPLRSKPIKKQEDNPIQWIG